MSISQFLQEATIWLGWSALGLGLIALAAFLVNWGAKYRLIGATIFTLLLSGSCWAFQQSYTPPVVIEGAQYVPVVYDNGSDLVVAQAPEDFPDEAIQPSLEQIAGNIKGGGRNGAKVHVRIRKIETKKIGISEPIILGEVIRDPAKGKTYPVATQDLIVNRSIKDEIFEDSNEGINNNQKENDLESIVTNNENLEELMPSNLPIKE